MQNTEDQYTQYTTDQDDPVIDPKRRYLCRHIFVEGHRCGSPAMRGESLCYNHNRARREIPLAGRVRIFVMPRIDDRASIQLAIFEVLARMTAGDLEFRHGATLLYGLQIASTNLPRRPKTTVELPPQVEEFIDDCDLGDLAPIVEIPTPEPEILSPEQKELTPPAETEPATIEPQPARLESPISNLEPSTPPTHASLTPYNNHNDFAYSGLPDPPRALPLSG